MDVQDLLNRVAQNLSVSRAFGSAYEKDGSMVIPVALVTGGGGAGEGSAGSSSAGEEKVPEANADMTDEDDGAESSSGSGGGFGGMVMPVGVYVVKDEKVRWIPAVNANLVIVVVFITLRMILRARFRAQRHAH